MGFINQLITLNQVILVGGWPTPLKNDGVRQLGLCHSQLNGKITNVPNHQPGFHADLVEFDGDFGWGFNGDLVEFDGDFMVIYWDWMMI